MTQRQTQDQIAPLLLIWAISIGGFVRFTPAILGNFPLMDGGLFYEMVGNLQANHYLLPAYTTYNAAQIPFTYPPLPFYLAAALADVFAIPRLELFRWLPPLLSTLAIFAFYLLSERILRDQIKHNARLAAALSTIAFAMLPSSYNLYIQGGGLTRGIGSIFSLLTLRSVYLLFRQRKPKYAIHTALAATILVLSHPEMTFHTVFVVILLWLFYGRDKTVTLSAFAVGAGVLILSAPWWITVLHRHGWAPFTATLGTSWHNWLFWTPLLTLNFGQEIFISLITVIGIVGILASLIKKRYLLPAWFVLPFIAEPRNPAFTATVPLAMLTSLGIIEVLIPGLRVLERRRKQLPAMDNTASTTLGTSFRLVTGVFLIYTLINAYAYASNMARYRVTDVEREAFAWITENTPENARFAMLTYGDPFNTPAQEWFPALTGRINLTTVQGYEWLGTLFDRKETFEALQTCIFEDLACVTQWAAAAKDRDYDYIYIYRGYVGGGSPYNLAGKLLDSLEAKPDYTLVYDTSAIKIYHYDTP